MVYPTLSEIEVKWRASGSGVCIIVEGETELEDAWFYNYWFGNRSREVTFFPQDGWEIVVDAVMTLRISWVQSESMESWTATLRKTLSTIRFLMMESYVSSSIR